ncbi:ArsR family transcriptional regulator [Geomonas sp. Red32]|uniref:VpaChn25_0724 family phage protein n=1 Tax=Geomonas sp. Red32 TaxID=2912856 RepID=UPI00202CC310|nr:ArsR family transcriptional regulator [Geomonas sp. Red32]MCM0081792.1 ArsR family transcriptional regulator [Geomonas sp. Red32]
MSNWANVISSNLRLILVRALEQSPGYELNESILHTVVTRFGHNVSRDVIKTELTWLKEQGLLTLEEVMGYYVATLTQRGIDVANGRSTVPGVDRPSPRS